MHNLIIYTKVHNYALLHRTAEFINFPCLGVNYNTFILKRIQQYILPSKRKICGSIPGIYFQIFQNKVEIKCNYYLLFLYNDGYTTNKNTSKEGWRPAGSRLKIKAVTHTALELEIVTFHVVESSLDGIRAGN